MADALSMSEALSSYRTAVEAPKYKQESEDRASLLSTQAEAARMKMAQVKEESTYSQLAKQAFLKAQEANANLDSADVSQRITLFDRAIQANKNNPEIQDRLFTQKQGLLSQQADLLKSQGEIRKQQQQAKADFVMESLTIPEVGADRLIARGKEENDPILVGFGAQLKDQAPIPMFGNKKYSQLSPEQQDAYRSIVVRGISPKGETTAHNLVQEQINWANLRRQQEADADRARLKEQEIATTRDKQEAAAEARRAKDADKTKQMKEATDKYVKDKAEAEAALLAAKQTGLFESDEEKETIRILTDKLKGIEDSYSIAKEMYGKKDIAVSGIKTEYSKESPAKPTSQKAFDALPSGAWFVNPADGKLLQKK